MSDIKSTTQFGQFYGNLHPKYAAISDQSYITKCIVENSENIKIGTEANILYSIDDIRYLELFDFRDSNNKDLLTCVLDRWYYFNACVEYSGDGKLKLTQIHIKTLEDDTELQRAHKRRSLRMDG